MGAQLRKYQSFRSYSKYKPRKRKSDKRERLRERVCVYVCVFSDEIMYLE